jgi:hypothetical protein
MAPLRCVGLGLWIQVAAPSNAIGIAKAGAERGYALIPRGEGTMPLVKGWVERLGTPWIVDRSCAWPQQEFHYCQHCGRKDRFPHDDTLPSFCALLILSAPSGRSDLSIVSDTDVQRVEDKLNSRPRKILGYRTPRKVFLNAKTLPLHFAVEWALLFRTDRRSVQNATSSPQPIKAAGYP